MSEQKPARFYGVAAEFAAPDALLAAVVRLRERDIGLLDALSPLPIPGMGEALGHRGPTLGAVASAVAALGGAGCFAMIAYATMVGYPFNIGGRPFFSWPSYVIPSFAIAMMTAAVAVFVAMLFLDRLPRLNHPVFNIVGIEGVTQDRLFLVVEAREDDFDADSVERELVALPVRPLHIQRVPR